MISAVIVVAIVVAYVIFEAAVVAIVVDFVFVDYVFVVVVVDFLAHNSAPSWERRCHWFS